MLTLWDKLPKFGINWASFDRDAAFENGKVNNEMYGHPDAVFEQRPDGHTFFVNFDIFKWLYFSQTSLINIKLDDFLTLAVLFLTMWINSCLSHNLQTCTKSFSV